jgi:catechol 2,3-dioxygenase-like lactoylglutathione lyase family enzyme
MLRGIDHLVIAVSDLEGASKAYTDLGFTVVPGGRHTGVGTYNALIAFADGSYLELIAFYEPRPDHRWWAALQAGGGLVDYCMQTDDLAADTMTLRKAGVNIGDPEGKNRKRPDGYDVRWRYSLARDDHRGIAPFLIEDETPRHERIPRETAHANSVTGIAALTVAVRDESAIRRWYAAVAPPGVAVDRTDLAGTGVGFAIGPHRLEFLVPRGPSGPIAEWLRARGAGPYAAVFTSTGAVATLDPGRTWGARLGLVGPVAPR